MNRDMVNQAVEAGDQTFVRVKTVAFDESFTAKNEWVQANILTPVDGVPFVALARDGNGEDAMFVGPEPFFVSGAQTFQNQSQTTIVVCTAPRREMLSAYGDGRDWPGNGALSSVVYESTFTAPALGVTTNWVYLNANLTWSLAPIGQTPLGMPFGYGAINPARRGRYYNVEFATQDNGNGLTMVHYVAANSPAGLDTLGMGYQISVNQAAMHGLCSIGDDAYAVVGSSMPSGLGYQSTMKSARNWTIAISAAVAGATGPGGFLSVLRRGF